MSYGVSARRDPDPGEGRTGLGSRTSPGLEECNCVLHTLPEIPIGQHVAKTGLAFFTNACVADCGIVPMFRSCAIER